MLSLHFNHINLKITQALIALTPYFHYLCNPFQILLAFAKNLSLVHFEKWNILFSYYHMGVCCGKYELSLAMIFRWVLKSKNYHVLPTFAYINITIIFCFPFSFTHNPLVRKPIQFVRSFCLSRYYDAWQLHKNDERIHNSSESRRVRISDGLNAWTHFNFSTLDFRF